MTVTRKDLNEIASTLNQRIQLYLKQDELDKAKAEVKVRSGLPDVLDGM